MSPKIRFTVDEHLVRFVREHGEEPDEFARRLFDAKVHRMRADDRMDRLQDRGIELPRRAAEMVREDRGRP